MVSSIKICTKCNEEKEYTDFWKHITTSDGLRGDCKTCNALKNKQWRNDNKDKVLAYKASHLDKARIHDRTKRFKKYGLTIDQYKDMLIQQGNACAICETTTPGRNNEFFAVDHDHVTSKVRGLLCFSCNIVLGHFLDDTNRLNRAIQYLNIATGKKDN